MTKKYYLSCPNFLREKESSKSGRVQYLDNVVVRLKSSNVSVNDNNLHIKNDNFGEKDNMMRRKGFLYFLI